MAVADDRAPPVFSNQHIVSVDDAAIGVREFRHQLGVAVAAARHRLRPLVIEPVLVEHREHGLGGIAGRALAHRVRRQVFPLRRPELHAEAPAQPVRIAGMVGVVMREDHAPDVPEALEELVPQRARLGVADAGVDDGPTALLLQQPEIDMVERERQRHAEPVDARRDFDGFARRRRLGPWILESRHRS